MNLYAVSLPAAPLNPSLEQTLLTFAPQGAEERLRRFRLPEDALRSLIGQLAPIWYLRTHGLIEWDVKAVFGRKGKGKPVLVEPILNPAFAFNTSHEGAYVLLGIARGDHFDIGVDVMKVPSNPREIEEGISEQLTSLERRVLAEVASEEQLAKLITLLWTLKEGYVKATGDGIGFGLNRIEVDVDAESLLVRSIAVDSVDVKESGWKWSSGWIGGGAGEYGWTVFLKGDTRPEHNVQIRHITWDDFIAPFIDTDNVQR